MSVRACVRTSRKLNLCNRHYQKKEIIIIIINNSGELRVRGHAVRNNNNNSGSPGVATPGDCISCHLPRSRACVSPVISGRGHPRRLYLVPSPAISRMHISRDLRAWPPPEIVSRTIWTRTSEMLALFGNSPNCVSMDTHFGDACLIWQLAQLRVHGATSRTISRGDCSPRRSQS